MATISLFGNTIRETINVLRKNATSYRNEITITSTDEEINGRTITAEEIIDLLDGLYPTVKLSAKTPKKEATLGTTEKKSSINKNAVKIKESTITANDIFENRSKAIMRIVVTLILLGISVFLLVTQPTESKTLPCSIISAVTGYWLK